jgi:hypothetical protein
MRSEYSPREKTSGPTCLLPRLFVRICKSVVSVLLFVVVSSWFSVLWIVPIRPMSEVRKKGAGSWSSMFSSSVVSLTQYPLPSFRPWLFLSLADSMYIPCA